MKSKSLEINRNEQRADSKTRESDQDRSRVSAKVLSIVAVLFGFVVVACWYLNIPALAQVYLDWTPMQFDILSGIFLIVMGAFLAFVVRRALNAWRKGESLQKKLEAEIGRRRKIQRDLDRAQEISLTGNWVLELSSQEMWWSNEVCRILDCSPNNTVINFERFLKSVHPDDCGFVEQEIQKAIGLGTAFILTHRVIRRDGSIRMVKQRSEIYLDREGKPTQIRGTLQDITDQREAENQAARLGRIVDKSFNEIYIFDAETLQFTKVNLAARLNLRYSMEELHEMTPLNLLPEFTPEKFKKLIASLKRGMESVTVFETVYRRNNGTLYPVDIRLQLASTETNPQFVAIVQDISERKKVESLFSRVREDLDKRVHERTADLTILNKERQIETNKLKMAIEILEASENRLIEIINNVADGIITIDEEGTIHSFNRAAEHLFGFGIEEVLGKNIDILMVGPDGVHGDEYFKNPLPSEKSASLGVRRMVTARKKDGTTFLAELAVSETVIEDQRMFTGLIRYHTEKEEFEHDLMRIAKPMTNS